MQPALFACKSVALARAMTAANLEFAVSSGERSTKPLRLRVECCELPHLLRPDRNRVQKALEDDNETRFPRSAPRCHGRGCMGALMSEDLALGVLAAATAPGGLFSGILKASSGHAIDNFPISRLILGHKE